MSDDLVKRLRSIDDNQICTGCYTIVETADEAASRIEKLEAALRGVIAIADRDCPEFRFARKALDAE